MSQSHLSPTEVTRRLPAAGQITDKDLRDQTIAVSAEAPTYFCEVPASTSGYHPPLCRKRHSLWIHTLMVATAVERLVDSYTGRYDVDANRARAAALLHDQRKNSPPDAPSGTSVSDHDVQMATVFEERDLPAPVVNAVETHMGPWYDGPEPKTPLAELVHNADMLASTGNATLAIPSPIPEELQKYDLSGADF